MLFLKAFAVSSICTFSLLGLSTLSFAIHFLYSSRLQQLSLSLSVDRSMMYGIIFITFLLIVVSTVIIMLVAQNRALKTKKK